MNIVLITIVATALIVAGSASAQEKLKIEPTDRTPIVTKAQQIINWAVPSIKRPRLYYYDDEGHQLGWAMRAGAHKEFIRFYNSQEEWIGEAKQVTPRRLEYYAVDGTPIAVRININPTQNATAVVPRPDQEDQDQ